MYKARCTLMHKILNKSVGLKCEKRTLRYTEFVWYTNAISSRTRIRTDSHE